MVYIFSSFQPKSLRQTNLLVHRREFTFSLLCLTSTNGLVTSNLRLTFRVFTSSLPYLTDTNGLVTSNSRLTFNLFVRTTSTYICPDAFYLARLDRNLTAERRCFGRLTFKSKSTRRAFEPFTSTCRYIPLLTLSLETYKESRQKRASTYFPFGRSYLVSLSRPQRNLIGEQLCFGRSNLACLLRVRRREFTSSLLCLTCTNGLVTSNLWLTFISIQKLTHCLLCLTQTDDRCFGRIIHGRANIILTLVEALKDESHLARPERNLRSERLTFKLERIWIILSLFWLTSYVRGTLPACSGLLCLCDGFLSNKPRSTRHTTYVYVLSLIHI